MITRESEECLRVPGSFFKDGETCGDIFFPQKRKRFYTILSSSEDKRQVNHSYISTHSG